MTTTSLILIAVALLLVSAFFSGAEVAFFGLRRVDREQLSNSGRPVDALVKRLIGQPKRLVVSVLIGNETVNMTMAAIAVSLWVPAWPEASPWMIAALAVLASAAVVILFGEIIPKTRAIQAPIAWARQVARPIALFALAVTPARWIIQGLTEVLARPFGGTGRPRAADLSEEEFRKLVDAGSAEGQVDARERRLIHRVFEFGDKNVGQVMTPRDKIFALAYDLPMARLVKEVAARGFSRVPIYTRSLDNIRGVLNAKDLVKATAGEVPARVLSDLLHEPLFVPRTTPIARLFHTFKQKKVHLALVVSEYGKLLGLVTMDDLLAQLFGDLYEERDNLQRGARRGRGGRTPLPGSLPTIDQSTQVPREPAAVLEGSGDGVPALDTSADGVPAPVTSDGATEREPEPAPAEEP